MPIEDEEEKPKSALEESPAPDADVPAVNPREARKDAASFASGLFAGKRSRNRAAYNVELTEYQLADLAIECKHEAEKSFGTKISLTLDIEGNWWFQ